MLRARCRSQEAGDQLKLEVSRSIDFLSSEISSDQDIIQ